MTRELQEKLESYQRVWAEVDLDAIWENMVHMKENIAENTKILAVIKTDGYGHGGVPIAKMLEQLDFMFGYAAATYEEAHVLREAGVKKPILILGYTFPYCYEELIREEIRPAVYRRDTVEELAAAAAKVGKKAKVHIKVDTGMGRIGITPDEEGLEFVRFLIEHPELEVEGIFTHFAKSDEADKTSANHQLELFQNFIDKKYFSTMLAALKIILCFIINFYHYEERSTKTFGFDDKNRSFKIQAEKFVSDSGRASSEHGLIQRLQQDRFCPLPQR